MISNKYLNDRESAVIYWPLTRDLRLKFDSLWRVVRPRHLRDDSPSPPAFFQTVIAISAESAADLLLFLLGSLSHVGLTSSSGPGLPLLFFAHLLNNKLVDLFLAGSFGVPFQWLLLLWLLHLVFVHLFGDKLVDFILRQGAWFGPVRRGATLTVLLGLAKHRFLVFDGLARELLKGHPLSRVGAVYPLVPQHGQGPVLPFGLCLQLGQEQDIDFEILKGEIFVDVHQPFAERLDQGDEFCHALEGGEIQVEELADIVHQPYLFLRGVHVCDRRKTDGTC